jgi:cytochrome P450
MPDDFVPGRSGGALSFGAGVHRCPGRRLGSLEVEEAILALLPNLEQVMSSAAEPQVKFTGPNGAPALRQVPHWKLSFR